MARLPWRVAAATLVILAAGAAGCRKRDVGDAAGSPDPTATPRVVPTLGSVVVEDRTPPEARPTGVSLDATAMAAAARAQLEAAKIFAAPGGSGPQPAANVTVLLAFEHVEAADKAAAHVVAKLTIAPRPEGLSEDRWKEDAEVVSEAPYERAKPPADLPAMFRKLADRTVHDLLDQYVARQKLRTAAEAEILRVLSSDRGELRDEAIKVSGERKLGGTVARLLELLDDDDEGVRDAALGALVAMRERRAVSVLTRSRSLRDRREMRKIIEAVSVLGGDEARQYLEFVAEAHDDADMKQLAKDALARMARRAKQGGG